MTRPLRFAPLVGAVILAACGSSPTKVGDRGQACYPNQTCNAGLSCVDSFCVRLGEAGAGGGSAGTGVAGNAGTAGTGGAGGAAGADAGTPDATTDATTDASGTFSIRNVPGLAYWFDAGKGVTLDGSGLVVAWADQSGNGHTEAPRVGNLGPTVLPSAVNGRPVLHFETRMASLAPQTDANVFGTGEVLVEMVATAIVDPARPSNLPFTTTGTPLARLGYDLAAKHAAFTLVATGQGTSKSFPGGTPTTAGPHLVGFHRTGTGATAKLELRLDGANDDAEIDPAYEQDLGDDVAFVGPADVAEVIIILGPVSPADLAAIEGYLKAKYGL